MWYVNLLKIQRSKNFQNIQVTWTLCIELKNLPCRVYNVDFKFVEFKNYSIIKHEKCISEFIEDSKIFRIYIMWQSAENT